MDQSQDEITFFAKTNFRNREVPFGIKTDDRRRHMYVIGKTGMGKTTMMENMVIQDIRNGHGVCFIDAHGDSVARILDFIPPSRINDVIYFNPSDLAHPIAFNVMESVDDQFKHLVADGLMGVFTKIWANMWSSRMEYILSNTVRALLDSPGNTILGIARMYIDKAYRKKIVDNVRDPMVKLFWTDEYANYDPRYVKEAVAPIQNKVGQFLSSAIIRNIVGQPKSTIDPRKIMDEKKILLVDISKGKIGEDNSALLGAMLVTKLQMAALSRVDIPKEEDRSDFYLYVDEFQNFATDSFATILSEARKYRLNLIMGHQYIAQLAPDKNNTKLRDAIFGNVGTIVCFRVGAQDAEYLETEFAPVYTPNDLVNLPKYEIILKLMINGIASEPFSAHAIPVNPAFQMGNAQKVINVSRERYSNPLAEVEEKIVRWMGSSSKLIVPESSLKTGNQSEVLGDFSEVLAPNKLEELSDTTAEEVKINLAPVGPQQKMTDKNLKKIEPSLQPLDSFISEIEEHQFGVDPEVGVLPDKAEEHLVVSKQPILESVEMGQVKEARLKKANVWDKVHGLQDEVSDETKDAVGVIADSLEGVFIPKTQAGVSVPDTSKPIQNLVSSSSKLPGKDLPPDQITYF